MIAPLGPNPGRIDVHWILSSNRIEIFFFSFWYCDTCNGAETGSFAQRLLFAISVQCGRHFEFIPLLTSTNLNITRNHMFIYVSLCLCFSSSWIGLNFPPSSSLLPPPSPLSLSLFHITRISSWKKWVWHRETTLRIYSSACQKRQDALTCGLLFSFLNLRTKASLLLVFSASLLLFACWTFLLLS